MGTLFSHNLSEEDVILRRKGCWSLQYSSLGPEEQDRFHRLVQSAELSTTQPSNARTFDSCFEEFRVRAKLEANVDWAAESVFWSAYAHIPGLKVIRRQMDNGLCHMLAPFVLHHYLRCIATNKPARTVNVSKYMNSLRGKQLERYLFHRGRECARSVLDRLCEYEGGFTPLNYDSQTGCCEDIGRMDKLYELVTVDRLPLLVTMRVDPEFRDLGRVSYLDKHFDESSCKRNAEYHSMLIVGARVDKTTRPPQKVYLLQGWWEGKYFAEASLHYMAYCHGKVGVIRKIADLPPCITDDAGLEYAETTMDSADCNDWET